MKKIDTQSLFLVGIGFLVPMLAAFAARKAVGGGYRLITHEDPPKNPANLEVEWKEALIWAAVSGLVGGMSRLAARRWIAGTFIPSEGYDMDEEVEKII